MDNNEITKKAELMKKHFSISDALEDTKWAANTILELQQQNKKLQDKLDKLLGKNFLANKTLDEIGES